MFTFFDHQQLRRYLLAFGSFFDSIFVVRYDITGKETQRIQVPIQYGPKEKWLLHITQDPDFLQSVAITVPRLSYELTSITYDGNRKANSLNQLRFPTGSEQNKLARTYIGVPYILNFNMSGLVKFQTDGFQIIEQIIPFFTPDLTFVINNVPELGISDQIPLTLTGISESDNYEGDFEKRRIIVWSMDFSMKVYFYGPNKSQGRINEVIVDVYNSPIDSLNEPPEYFVTQDNLETPLETEDGQHLMTEETNDAYLSDPTIVIDVKADPLDQQAQPPDVHANTTITEAP